MTWTNEVNPFGDNHTPLLIGLSYEDGETVVPIAVDPATGAVLTEGGSVASSVNATVYQGTTPWVVGGNVTIYGNVTANVVVSQVFQGGAPWTITGSVTDTQGTNPWVVSGTVAIGSGGSGVTTVYQGGAPWLVNASVQGIINGIVTIANPSSGGTATVFQGGAPWLVNASVIGQIPVSATVGTISVGNFPATQPISGSVTIYGNVGGSTTVYQGGAPWLVNASVIGQIPVSATVPTLVIGLMPAVNVVVSQVFQGGAPWLVNASVVGQQAVTASIAGIPNVLATVTQGTSPWLVNASVVGVQNVNASIIGVQNVIATVLQGTSPWLVNASVIGQIPVSATVPTLVIGLMPAVNVAVSQVFQGGAPWLVNASVIGQLPVTASLVGTPTVQVSTIVTLAIGSMPAVAVNVSQVFQGGAPWTVTGSVGASQLGAPWLMNASVVGVPNVNASIIGVQNVIATVLQGTNPWLTNTSVIGTLPVYATVITFSLASILSTVTQGTNPWLVNASVVGLLNVNATYAAPWNVTVTESGTVNTFSLPQASGGLSVYQGNLSATTATIKASAGQVYGYHIFNVNATQAYVNFYNASSATVGLTSPLMQLGIPASGGATFDSDIGMAFSAPILVSAGVSIGGVGTPGTPISVNVFYK